MTQAKLSNNTLVNIFLVCLHLITFLALEPPKTYESPPAPEPEPSGGFLASVATGSLAFIIFMAVFSVYCFQKHGKDPRKGGQKDIKF